MMLHGYSFSVCPAGVGVALCVWRQRPAVCIISITLSGMEYVWMEGLSRRRCDDIIVISI